jgi:hypothetical protein
MSDIDNESCYCIICYELLINNKQCNRCKKSICGNCIEQIKKCPLCNESKIDNFKNTDFSIESQIKLIIKKCNKCDKIIHKNDIIEHYQQYCTSSIKNIIRLNNIRLYYFNVKGLLNKKFTFKDIQTDEIIHKKSYMISPILEYKNKSITVIKNYFCYKNMIMKIEMYHNKPFNITIKYFNVFLENKKYFKKNKNNYLNCDLLKYNIKLQSSAYNFILSDDNGNIYLECWKHDNGCYIIKCNMLLDYVFVILFILKIYNRHKFIKKLYNE